MAKIIIKSSKSKSSSRAAADVAHTLPITALTNLVSARSIFDTLSVQQGRYMKRFDLSIAPVRPSHLKQYASLCARAYDANLKKCKTPADHRKLFRALERRLKIDATKPEFLNAVPRSALRFED